MPAPRILIVDDDSDVRDSVAECLRSAGYDTAEAGNGREALDVLECMAHLPSLILLDVIMPVMGGVELLERLVGDQRFAAIPVVIVAGLQGYQCKGARAFVRKPLSLDTLLRVAEEHAGAPSPLA